MFYASIFNNGSGAFRETGALRFFYYPKGALTHHLPAGQVVVAFPLVRPCALRGGLCSLRRAPANAAGAAVPVIIACAEGSLRCFPPPAKTCPRQLCRRGRDGHVCPPLLSLLRKRNRKIGGENDWRFTIWKRRSSAAGQAAPPARPRPT